MTWTDLTRPPLREAALRAALTVGERPAWRRLEVVAATASTNADVAARARVGEPEGLVLTTDDQTGGRGRLDRAWTTPPRAAIAVSVLLRPRGVPVERFGWLPLLAGVAVIDALTRHAGLAARLKWPNDVLVEVDGADRKLCGILAELVPTHDDDHGVGVVLGTGINVSRTAAELPVPTATSLLLAGATTTDRDTVLRAYLRALAARYADWVAAAGDPALSGLAADYRRACATLGRSVEVHLPVGSRRGVAQDVDDDGRLVVRPTDHPGDGESLRFAAGDVVHLR